MPLTPDTGIWFETVGGGPAVFVGLPLMASAGEIFGPAGAAMRAEWEEALAGTYTLILVDYPGIGRSRDQDPDQLTVDRVVADLLGVADAAGVERFAWVGYSWSAAVGLQLATRSDRLTALAIGGWAPLAGPYQTLYSVSAARVGNVPPSARAMLRSDDQYRQWPAFYASLLDWPEDAAIGHLAIPRLLFFGSDGDLIEDGVSVPIASICRDRRLELESTGWQVEELPGFAHGDVGQSARVLPMLRAFLERNVQ